MSGAVLITRPEPDASCFAQMLARKNCQSLKCSLTEIIFAPDINIDSEGVQMIVATSANALRADLPAEILMRPVFAVGAHTAEAARRAGFQNIAAAHNDTDSLARKVIASCPTHSGRVLYLTGRHRTGDLAGRLVRRGFDVRIVELYEARAVNALPPPIIEAFRRGKINCISFFSPRAAEIFARLADAHDLHKAVGDVWAACFALSCAAPLDRLGFREIRIAQEPVLEAMCDLIAS